MGGFGRVRPSEPSSCNLLDSYQCEFVVLNGAVECGFRICRPDPFSPLEWMMERSWRQLFREVSIGWRGSLEDYSSWVARQS